MHTQLTACCRREWRRFAVAAFFVIAFLIIISGFTSLDWFGRSCGWPMKSILFPAAGLILFGSFIKEVSEIRRRRNVWQELRQFNWFRLVLQTLSWGSLAYAAHYVLNPCD